MSANKRGFVNKPRGQDRAADANVCLGSFLFLILMRFGFRRFPCVVGKPFSGGLPHVLDIKMIKSGARKSHLVTLAMEHHWHGMIGIC